MIARMSWFFLSAICGLFILLNMVFYVQTGSFERAGAKMDDLFSAAGDEAEIALRSAGDRTEAVIEDIADGPDAVN